MRGRWLLLCLLAVGVQANADDYVNLPGGKFKSVLRYGDTAGNVAVAPFALMKQPVTNAQFLAFVRTQPQWRRDRVATAYAETRYLQHWSGATTLGATAKPQQPVVNVSWFAASAYCESQGARLPTWSEWEYAAAADQTRRDARKDPAWREAILGWYGKPANSPLPAVGQTPANVYGVQDLNGLVWEWVDDYAAILVSGDSREQGNADLQKFCGAGALSMDDQESYAVLMRIAMLSSLEAANTTTSLGFRCAIPRP